MKNFGKSNADRYESRNPITSKIKYVVIKVKDREPLTENN